MSCESGFVSVNVVANVDCWYLITCSCNSQWRMQKIVLVVGSEGGEVVWMLCPSGGAGSRAPRSWSFNALFVMVTALS